MFKTKLFNELRDANMTLAEYLYTCKIRKATLSKEAKEQLNQYMNFCCSYHTALDVKDDVIRVCTDRACYILENVSVYRRSIYSLTKFLSEIVYDEDDYIILDEPIFIHIADYFDGEGVKHIAELEVYDNMLSIVVDADCLAIVPIREEELP